MSKRQRALETMADEFKVPKPIQDAADKYNKAMLAKNRATAKFNGARDELIDQMVEHRIERVRVLAEGGGDRILRLDKKHLLKVETPKKPTEDN